MELRIFARFHARPGNEGAVVQAIRDNLAPSRGPFDGVGSPSRARDPASLLKHGGWRMTQRHAVCRAAVSCRGRCAPACVTSTRITTRWMGKPVDGVVGRGRRTARWNPAPSVPGRGGGTAPWGVGKHRPRRPRSTRDRTKTGRARRPHIYLSRALCLIEAARRGRASRTRPPRHRGPGLWRGARHRAPGLHPS
jgi:hypothetical protein